MTLKIDFFKFGLDNPKINAWFGGIYKSFFRALEELGCRVTYSNVQPNKEADVLVVPVGGGQDKSSAKAMQTFGGPVVLNIGSASYWLRKYFLERWRDQILFTYGSDFSQYSRKLLSEVGICYYSLSFGSDINIMHPLEVPKYYDVVFVGNPDSGVGRHNYLKKLMKASYNRKVLLLGPDFDRYGFPFQSIAWGKLLNIVYNMSHICINIHNDEQKMGKDQRLDTNNRLFDLAMAGCFQISNAPHVVRHFFDETEVVAVDPPDDWVSAVMYYMDNPSETESFRLAARKRAIAEYTWKHRAEEFLKMINNHLPYWRKSKYNTSYWKKIIRLRDTNFTPFGLHK